MIYLYSFSFSDSISGMLNNIISGLPKFLLAIAVLLVGIFVARMITKAVKAALKTMGIDKLGEKLNEIDIVDKANLKIELSGLVSKIIYYILILFVLIVATDILDLEPVSALVVNIFEFMPKLIVALIILVMGTLFADGVKSIVNTALTSLNIPSAKLISSFLFYFLFINILVSALAQAEINTEFLATNISILIGGLVFAFALGYGLATRSTMANYLASFYSKGRFNIGDKVTLDKITGLIVDIDKTALTLDTGDRKVLIPLSKVSDGIIEIHN